MRVGVCVFLSASVYVTQAVDNFVRKCVKLSGALCMRAVSVRLAEQFGCARTTHTHYFIARDRWLEWVGIAAHTSSAIATIEAGVCLCVECGVRECERARSVVGR